MPPRNSKKAVKRATKEGSSLLKGMPWVPAGRTDVQATWRRHGWVSARSDDTSVCDVVKLTEKGKYHDHGV